jgi:hypothetical protein
VTAAEPYHGPAISPEQLDVGNADHVRFLRSISIQLRQQDGVVRLVYQKVDDEEESGAAAQGAGLLYIQELIKLQQAETKSAEKSQRGEVHVQVATGNGESVTTFEAGPAAFGPNLDNEYHIYEFCRYSHYCYAK